MLMSKSQQDITEVLAQVAKAVVGKLSMEDLLDKILNITMKTLDAEVCSIFLKDQENPKNEIICVAGAGYAKKLVGKARYKIGDGFTGSIAQSGQSWKIDSRQKMQELYDRKEIQWSRVHDEIQWVDSRGESQFRNLMALPLKTELETFGVIKVENKHGENNCFSEEDFELFKAISNIVITLTLQNARLHKQRDMQSQMIKTVAAAVVRSLEMQTLLENIIKTTMTSFEAEACSIFLRSKDDPNKIECVVGEGYATNIKGKQYISGRGVTGHVFQTGNSYKVKSNDELKKIPAWQGAYDSYQWAGGASQFRNLMILPLKIGDEILGVIKVENKRQDAGESFSDDEFQSFNAVANVLALMIKNVQLYGEQSILKENQIILKTIAAKAAHKINNQIARYDFIKLALHDEIQRWLPSKNQLKDLENRIAQTTDNLKRLTDDFKSYSKEIVLEQEEADLNQIIRDEVNEVERIHKVKVVTDLSTSLLSFSFDKGRLGESIREMLGNSIKAHAENIWITTEQQHSENNQIVAVITIRDDGAGVPKDFEEKLFVAFYSTRPDGTGLGLSTVKETVEKHGGKIQFKPGEKGARFEITLPMVAKTL